MPCTEGCSIEVPQPSQCGQTALKTPCSQALSKLNVSLSLSLSVGQVRVKEVYEEDDCWYLVQELVAGGRVLDQ